MRDVTEPCYYLYISLGRGEKDDVQMCWQILRFSHNSRLRESNSQLLQRRIATDGVCVFPAFFLQLCSAENWDHLA